MKFNRKMVTDAMGSKKCNLVIVFIALILFQLAKGDDEVRCSVLEEQCAFPFVSENNEEHNACIDRRNMSESTNILHVCQTRLSTSILGPQWGECGPGCLDDDGLPIFFEGDTSSLSVFCKSKNNVCVFPFVYNNKSYDACTKDDAAFEWCATAVDSEGYLIPGFYGQCDPKTCDPDYYKAEAEALFEEDGIKGEVRFRQHEPNASMLITGTVEGFEPNSEVALYVHEAGDCNDIGDIFQHLQETSGELFLASTNEEGVVVMDFSVDRDVHVFEMPEESSLLHRAVVLRLLSDEAKGNDTNRITAACAVIEETGGMTTLVLILHLLALLAIILLVLLLCLICVCCCRRCCCKKGSRSKDPDASDAPIQNGGSKRRPLFDELSIPFIDASPSTTPKVGRSVEKLAFFRRSSSVAKSRVSLSSVPPLYTPPPPPPSASKMEIVWKERISDTKKDVDKVVV